RNALYLNTGAGRFREAAFLCGVASTDWTWSTLFGDLDNDGRLDLFATNGIARFDMNPDIQIRVSELWRNNRRGEAVDLIRNVPLSNEKNLALRNTGDLKFAKTGADWGLDYESVSHGAALIDLDRDGDLDVVTNDWNSPVSVFENLTVGEHSVEVALRG